jgi:hypothetical protein
MDKAIAQLRQHEKDVWVRNRGRQQVDAHVEDTKKQEEEWATDAEDLKAWRKAQDAGACACKCKQEQSQSWSSFIASAMYTAYTWVFYCRRNVMNTFFHDESKERQKLIIEIPLPPHPWMCVSGTVGETEYDVTDIVNSKLSPGQRLTVDWLNENTDIPEDSTITWEYIDSLTFEVHEIPSDGVVNEVKPKTD